jgi:hypothetical protein
MAGWELVPALVRLRADLDELAPGRDRKSDGTIGDRAHQESVSDHNDDEVGRVPVRDADSKHEVHAYDADADLRTPGLTMEMVVQHILGRCRSGAEKRLTYIIFNRRIWSASRGWTQRAYSGASPHTEHAHFSASYTTKHEADASSWRLEDIPVALTDADRKFITDLIAEKAGDGLDLDAPLFPGEPSASWKTRYPNTKATLRNALAFAAYDSHDAEKAVGRLTDRVAALEAKLAD